MTTRSQARLFRLHAALPNVPCRPGRMPLSFPPCRNAPGGYARRRIPQRTGTSLKKSLQLTWDKRPSFPSSALKRSGRLHRHFPRADTAEPCGPDRRMRPAPHPLPGRLSASFSPDRSRLPPLFRHPAPSPDCRQRTAFTACHHDTFLPQRGHDAVPAPPFSPSASRALFPASFPARRSPSEGLSPQN